MEWDDLRFALAVARAGTLAAAARKLKVDHTTVGRRVEALERALGQRLFARTPGGYVATAEGESLVPALARIEEEVLALERGAGARGVDVTGMVRITAGEFFGTRFLGPRLGELSATHPALSLELLSGPHVLDLARREADVAVRFFRSEHGYLVVRKAADLGFGVYAAQSYVQARGAPRSAAEVGAAAHQAIGSESDTVLQPEAAWFEGAARGARWVLRTNSTAMMFEAVRAGLGVAALPCFVGDVTPGVVRVAGREGYERAIWVTVHRDLQRTPRVRAVLDWLTLVFRREAALLSGRSPRPVKKRARG